MMSARPVPLPPVFQAMHLCHSVFSCFSPAAEFHWRVVASEKFATLLPLFVVRISGSLPRFPMRVTLFRLRLTTPPQIVTFDKMNLLLVGGSTNSLLLCANRCEGGSRWEGGESSRCGMPGWDEGSGKE